jgi:hypothetical protein
MIGGRVAFVRIFCIAILVVSGAYADKPEKPGKPGGGPEPEGEPYYSSGTYKGHLFINFFGAGKNQEYLVRFRGTKGLEYLSIEIVGGVIEKDNKNKALTVRFTDEDCRVLVDGCPTPGCGEHIAFVTFTLVRYPV